jgi:predicted AAA+ superfamily ATPase
MPELNEVLQRASHLMERLEALLPQPLREPQAASHQAFRYVRHGLAAQLQPVQAVAHMEMAQLCGIDAQKERLLRNTGQFVRGLPANHVLLTGARGTGKSSLVRACLSAFAGQGLRLIEVDKTDLVHLPDIAQAVAGRPERFIVFCDDLSFEAHEGGYKALKSMLDGTVASGASNLLIYATSNRRHLLPESMKDNLAARHTEDGELHPGEAVEEKISLSERFGLWISFYPFSQDEYLAIVAQWLRAWGLSEPQIEAARAPALVFALERGSRSGRVAQQFAKDHVGQLRFGQTQPGEAEGA